MNKNTIITIASLACSIAGVILGNIKQNEMINKAVAEQLKEVSKE